jgi:hypothetical protein
MNKKCSKCGIEKDRSDFYKDVRKPFGIYSACKLCHNKVVADYASEHKKEKKEQHAIWYKANCVDQRKKKAIYRKSHRREIQDHKNMKYHTDIDFRIKECLSSRLRHAVRGHSKSASTMKLLGCSINELKQHLESQFIIDMNWDNYGEWHVDHIKPCKLFDLTKEAEQRKCFHYSNLQPLWAEDNIKKGCSY